RRSTCRPLTGGADVRLHQAGGMMLLYWPQGCKRFSRLSPWHVRSPDVTGTSLTPHRFVAGQWWTARVVRVCLPHASPPSVADTLHRTLVVWGVVTQDTFCRKQALQSRRLSRRLYNRRHPLPCVSSLTSDASGGHRTMIESRTLPSQCGLLQTA